MSHSHTVNAHCHGGGAHYHGIPVSTLGSPGGGNIIIYDARAFGGGLTTDWSGNTIGAEAPGTTASGGGESRPRNVAVNYIIRAY